MVLFVSNGPNLCDQSIGVPEADDVFICRYIKKKTYRFDFPVYINVYI